MRGFVRADTESVTSVEAFLRDRTCEPVVLGTVYVSTGRLAWAVTSIARARGITFGQLIFLASAPKRPHPSLEVQAVLERFEGLFVHECAHIWQYRREGAISFLRQYLKSYFSGIWKRKAIGRGARRAAYEAIPFEREAFRLERAWVEQSRDGSQGSRFLRGGSSRRERREDAET